MSPILWGPLIPLFWISGDVPYGFQSQSGQPYFPLAEVYVFHVPWDLPLVQHLPTSWQPAWLPNQSLPHTCDQALVGPERETISLHRPFSSYLDSIYSTVPSIGSLFVQHFRSFYSLTSSTLTYLIWNMWKRRKVVLLQRASIFFVILISYPYISQLVKFCHLFFPHSHVFECNNGKLE